MTREDKDLRRCRKTLAWVHRKGAPAASDYALLNRAEEWTMVTGMLLVGSGFLLLSRGWIPLVTLPPLLCCLYVFSRLSGAKRCLLGRREWNLGGAESARMSMRVDGQAPALRDVDREHCRRVLAGQRMCKGKCSLETDLGSLEGSAAFWDGVFLVPFVGHSWLGSRYGFLPPWFGLGAVILLIIMVGFATWRTARAKRFLIAHQAWNLSEAEEEPGN